MTKQIKIANKNISLLAITAAALSFVLASGMIVQPAFAHGLNFKTLNVPGVGQRGVTIVLGHTNEPTYGAKPGIHDGKHNLEVLLSDTYTKLPLTGAQLKIDKYYFKDFKTFQKAKSLKDATEIVKNVTVGSVFGDPGHYMARQVQKDGIYGYRLYGTISYFKVASLNVDTTVFCTSTEGATTKFNSPGWVGGFGCTEDIDNILFPTKNPDVNPGNNGGKASLDLGSSDNVGAVQQASLPASDGSISASASVPVMSVYSTTAAATDSASSVSPTASIASMSMLQMLATIIGIPAAAVGGVFGIMSYRQSRADRQL
jgi:hypothetical protein